MRDLLRHYRAERWSLAILAILLVVGALFETLALLLVVPIAQAVTTGTQSVRFSAGPFSIDDSAGLLVVIALGLVAVSLVTRLLSGWLQTSIVIRQERRQRAELYSAFLRANWKAQTSEPPGRFQWITGLTAAHSDLLGIVANSARFGINVIAMLVAALVVSPLGAGFIILVGLGLYAAFRPLLRAARHAQERAVEARGRQDGQVAELVHLIGPMRTFGTVAAFGDRLSQTTGDVLREKRTAMLLGTSVTPVYQAIGIAVTLGILGYATTADLDVPAFGAVALLLLRSISYAQGIQNALHKYAEYKPIINELDRWNRYYQSSEDRSGGEALERINTLGLDRVTFSYDGNRDALHDVDLLLVAGEHVGLVGPSGSGKTTLAQTLLRFWLPASGAYTLNGVPAKEFRRDEFTRHVADVPQSPMLLQGSVHDNITLFRNGISRAAVIDAARRSGITEWVETLPDGYETLIGPGFQGVSGGQAQRIGLARALVGNPSLLVLDEPTSALDTDTEQLITDALKTLPSHVIVVLIAHRMSSLRHCDRIVVLDNGRVVADGSSSQVIEQNAYFGRAVAAGALL